MSLEEKLKISEKLTVEHIVLIAVLTAISALGTLPITGIPSVQAASFIIIMSGIVFGRKTGFIVGALTPVVIGLFLGLGFWTIFQMVGWALMGLTAGIFSKTLKDNIPYRAIFGFGWGFIYGWITSIAMLPFLETISIGSVLGLFVAGFPFDLTHAIVNVILLVLLFGIFERIFSRTKKKIFF